MRHPSERAVVETDAVRRRIVKLVRALCAVPHEVRDVWWNDLNQRYLHGKALDPTEEMIYTALRNVPLHSDQEEARARRQHPYEIPNERRDDCVSAKPSAPPVA